jgi:hypothetical protein
MAMKIISRLVAISISLIAMSEGTLYAQASDSLYHLETMDGNEFIGTLIERDTKSITIKTEKLGVLTIPIVDIKSMSVISRGAIKQGKHWFHNPQSTRYFWQPNGYGLKKGEGYYQSVWIFGNQISGGVSDHVTIGVGIVPLFLFSGAATPIWITPKFSIPIQADKVNLGAGILAGTVLGVGDDFSGDRNSNFGIAYGVATIGSRDKNLSLGLGYGYGGGEWARNPTISVGFMIRTGDRGYIISENYILNEVVILSFGGRRLVKKVAIDFGLFSPQTKDGNFLALPWLGFCVPFQSKNNQL